jgi:hypothetical protein
MANVSADLTRRFRLRTGRRNRIKRTSHVSHGAICCLACISIFLRSEELIRLGSWKAGVLARPCAGRRTVVNGRLGIYFFPPTHNTTVTVCGERRICCGAARRYGPPCECRDCEAALV